MCIIKIIILIFQGVFMEFKEELIWILDKKNKFIDEEMKYKLNIDFVHSLGKKCDSVGWSTLKMDEPDADKILDEIKKFCKEDGWRARGWYTRTYVGESDWYELTATNFKDSTVADIVNILADNGSELHLPVIKAFHELIPEPKEYYEICIPERFKDACIKNNIKGIEFCWLKDKGKYEAEQYFNIYPQTLIPRVCCDKNLENTDKAKINALGGFLPKIADIVTRLDHISIPDCYFKEDLPTGGIAYLYCRSTNTYCGRDKILIHKDTAQILVDAKVLLWKNLEPVPVVDSCPDGYVVDTAKEKGKPTNTYIQQMFAEYEKLKNKNRPVRAITEKDALKVLRTAKRDRKEDFNKKISKIQAERITDSLYIQLLPYYNIVNGGCLSDEYEFLPYNDSLSATVELITDCEKEELAENVPQGTVFAKCADGDTVILTNNGDVVRFSHEMFEIIDHWESVAQFVFDTITESE